MRRLFLASLAFLIVTFLSGSSLAGDYAHLNVIGFSKDGRYLAFEEFGTGDGSGYPYANIYFVDTSKNAFAASPVKVLVESETAKESLARSRAGTQAARKLKQFGIIRGNLGKLVLSHLMTDVTFEDPADDAVEKARFYEIADSMFRQGEHQLQLKPIKIQTAECEPYQFDNYILELTMTTGDKPKVLQKDATLPKARGCALSYRIQDVYLYEGSVAVFINVFTPGFEGPDMRFMAVTGSLDQ